MKRYRFLHYAIAVALLILLQWSCSLILETIKTRGEKQLTDAAPATATRGPRIIIFALDGATPDQLMEAIRSGKAPNLAGLLGKEIGQELFEHGYSAARALSVLPSSTIAA